MPVTAGRAQAAADRFAAVVDIDRPLRRRRHPRAGRRRPAPSRRQSPSSSTTATPSRSAVGSLPHRGVRGAVRAHRPGVHTGMITDGVIRPDRQGRRSPARARDRPRTGRLRAPHSGPPTCTRGSPRCRSLFRPASYTHHPATLSRLESLVVDQFRHRGRPLPARSAPNQPGDLPRRHRADRSDFSRAAALTGARSIIALRSTMRGARRSSSPCAAVLVTTARADVDCRRHRTRRRAAARAAVGRTQAAG